jgi:hypothetical protein
MAHKARISTYPYGHFFSDKTGKNSMVRWHYDKNKSQECSFFIEKVGSTKRQLISVVDHDKAVKYKEPYKMQPITPHQFMGCLVMFDEFTWFIENKNKDFKLRVLDMKPHPRIPNAFILSQLSETTQQVKQVVQIPHPRKKLKK